MHKKKILVVDDEPNIIQMLTSLLEINGYQVESASNGVEGLETAMKRRPNLILLDLVMPQMDGYQVMEKLRADEETKDIPVILFTAAPPDEAVQTGSSAIEAVDYVLKPFDRVTLAFLLERIRELTASKN